MKKKLCIMIVAVAVCVSGCGKNTVHQSTTPVPETTESKGAGNPSKDEKSPVSENTSKVITLRAISGYNMLGEIMEGWYADLLQEKLNIRIYGMDLTLPFQENYEEEYQKGIDIRTYRGEIGYYNDIRCGRTKNMEPYIKKHPEVFSRYSKVLKHIKKKTYRKTGKKGIYGMPIWLVGFNKLYMDRDDYSVCVPASSRHPKKAMDLIAWSASEEGIMNISFGPEGQMWKKKKGKYILIYDWEKKMNTTEKFVKTKDGKVDYFNAQFKMELVGDRVLGEKLLKENR